MKHRILLFSESHVEILEFSRSKDALLNHFFNPEIRLKITVPCVSAVSHSLDGRFIAIAAGKLLHIPGTKDVKHLVFGGNSDEIFFIKEKLSAIMSYHIISEKIITLSTQKRHPSPITYMAISKDSRFILTVSENPSIIFLQDCITHLTDKIIPGTSFGNVKNAVFHPKKSNFFLLCFTNGILGFYNTKKPIHPIFRIKDISIMCALFLPNEESSALAVDLNGQFSIIDFEKKEIQIKWSINTSVDSLSIKELGCNEWNIFVLSSHEKCFYFNQEGVKLSEYSINSEKVFQISTLVSDIPINESFLDIVIENSNSNISKFLISKDLHGCFSDKKIQSLTDDKFSGFLLSTNSPLKTKIDKIQSDFGKRLYVDKNNSSAVSIGKENIPFEDPSRNNFIANTPTKDLSMSSYINKNDTFSPNKTYEAQSTFKFETPKTSKKKINFPKLPNNTCSFQKNQLISEKSPEKYLMKFKTSDTPDIWCELGVDQIIDIESSLVNCSPLKEDIRTHETKDSSKNTLSISENSKFQNSNSFSTNKELLEFDLKKDFSTDMLTFKDMLYEAQKGIRQDIQCLHVELIKQFKNKEIENLKKENKKLVHELSNFELNLHEYT
ncbi:unnamed protein product [Pneumocystis jirovecii]|uniref:Uncharacterized protein n=1 Tax=Pneumocystis jirovecii TaxID=42068 RepID=L0PCB9_PNEJI|nr:unnamed protein product [Pneumocystis jirovecii]